MREGNIVDLVDRYVGELRSTQLKTELTGVVGGLEELLRLRTALRDLGVKPLPEVEGTKRQVQTLVNDVVRDLDIWPSLQGAKDRIAEDVDKHLEVVYSTRRNFREHIDQLNLILGLLDRVPKQVLAQRDIEQFFDELARRKLDRSDFPGELMGYVDGLERHLQKAESELPGTELVKRAIKDGVVPLSELTAKEVVETLESPVSKILGIKVIADKDTRLS